MQGAVEGQVRIRIANYFFRLRNQQKLVRIRFENIRYPTTRLLWYPELWRIIEVLLSCKHITSVHSR